jgi:FixJ family two-component response regulator
MPVVTGPVLVIDADAAVRQSLKFALEQECLEARLYENGAQLFADRKLPPTGCLVVDLMMPGRDGIDLVGRLREHHTDLPAILITSPAFPRLQALRAGFRQVLEKPLEDGSLARCLHHALKHRPACARPDRPRRTCRGGLVLP